MSAQVAQAQALAQALATSNGDKARDACRKHMSETGLEPDAVLRLERGVFNASQAYADEHSLPRDWGRLEFRAVYDAKARSAIVNVDPRHNADLRARIDAGVFEPHFVPFMPPEARMPKLWEAIEERAAVRAQLIASGDALAGIVVWSDRYKCSKCKQRKCKYTEVQTRSADEAMSVLVRCYCGNRWRAV